MHVQLGGRDRVGEDDSQQAARQEPRVLSAACKGGLPGWQEGRRPSRHEGMPFKHAFPDGQFSEAQLSATMQ